MKIRAWFDSEADPVWVTVRRSWLGGVWGHDSWVFHRTIWTRRREISPAHLRHELTHVRQYQRYGVVGFLRRYWFGWRHQLEAEAHQAEAAEWPQWA